jgi:hypothetical protein
MAATITIFESNDNTGEDITPATNLNMGNVDDPNLTPASNPITAGNNSYEKWVRFGVNTGDAGGSTSINNINVYVSGPLNTGATLWTNYHQTQGTYDTIKKTTWSAPATTTTNATQDWSSGHTSAVGANLGIGGSLTGTMTISGSLPQYSDYAVLQIRTTGSAVSGTTITMTFRYDETA